MNDIKFVQELMKELYATGVALTMRNSDTGEFSIVPKREYFITVNRTPNDIKEKLQSKPNDSSFPYVGKTIVLTGDMTNLVNRAWLKRHLTRRGAIVKNAVTDKTDLLVVGIAYHETNKFSKARNLGVELVSYITFLKNIGYKDLRNKSTDEWSIDTSTGRKILMYKNCSVIEEIEADYVMRLIKEDKRKSNSSSLINDYVNHARPSQRRAAEEAVGMPTYSDERMREEELNQFSNEDRLRMLPKGRNLAIGTFEQAIIAASKKFSESAAFDRYMKEFSKRADDMEQAIDNIGKLKDKIEYRYEIHPDGSADIFKYVNAMNNCKYHIKKELLEGCKDLDGKGYQGAANWSYGDNYARMALERKFGKELVELCREHIVSKL